MFLMPTLYCCLLSLLSGPIGCLILWSRLTFFGETIAHASIFGLFISLYFQISMTLSMSIMVVIYCALIELFVDQKIHQSSLLPIFSYGVLGLGFVLIEQLTPTSAALFNILLGDVLLIRLQDVLLLAAIVVSVWALWLKFQKDILLTLLIPDLAVLKKVSLKTTRFMKNVTVGLAIALVIQATGMLLAMALLTIPPLSAKLISKTPYQMVLNTCIIAFISIFTGFIGGLWLDGSLGAMMSTCAFAIFLIVKTYSAIKIYKEKRFLI